MLRQAKSLPSLTEHSVEGKTAVPLPPSPPSENLCAQNLLEERKEEEEEEEEEEEGRSEESWMDGKQASKLRHGLIQTKDGHWNGIEGATRIRGITLRKRNISLPIYS